MSKSCRPPLPDERSQHVRAEEIVRIDEQDIGSGSDRDAGIPGAAEAAVPLMDDADVPVFRREGVAKRAGAIGGAVVDEDNLVILLRQILGQQAVDALIQERLDIVDRNDDGQFHPLTFLSFRFSSLNRTRSRNQTSL